MSKTDDKPAQSAPFSGDWHMHSRHSCDCKEGKIPTTLAATVAEVRACGITDSGITDHIHTPFNLPDLEASRRAFDALPHDPHLHFGVEASCVSQWEIDQIASGAHHNPVYGLRGGGPAGGPLALGLTAEDVARLGIEYVVGGTHWPMYVPFERQAIIRDYHRQNMFLVTNPLVNIVAHPWWWMGHWQDPQTKLYPAEPWFDDFGVIPAAMHDEFIAAARELGKVVEINICAMLTSPYYSERFRRRYCEYLATVKEAGVAMSLGSDHHAQHNTYHNNVSRGGDTPFAAVAELLTAVGISDADLWRLPPRAG